MAAWAGWVQTIGLAGFARRRLGVMSGSRAAREAGWKTAGTWSRMLGQLSWAAAVSGRLPRALEALRHGQVPKCKARIIEAQTAELPGAGVAEADVILAAAGQVKNPAGPAGLRPAGRSPCWTRAPPPAARRVRPRVPGGFGERGAAG